MKWLVLLVIVGAGLVLVRRWLTRNEHLSVGDADPQPDHDGGSDGGGDGGGD